MYEKYVEIYLKFLINQHFNLFALLPIKKMRVSKIFLIKERGSPQEIC